MKKILLITTLLATYFSDYSYAAEELLDEIVAVVEESVILRSELDRAVSNITKQLKGSGTQLPPKSILDKQVLERLISEEIQILQADLAGVRVSEAEVDTALSEVASKNNLSLQQMQMAIESEDLSFAEFRNDMSREIKAEKIRNGLANQEVKVSEQEIDLFLADNQLSQFEVRLGHILISLAPDAKQDEIATAKEKVDKIYLELEKGTDFAQLATKYSSGQKALEGGDLGWRASSELPTLFAEQIKSMKVGEFTHPVRSQSGLHILKLTDKRKQEKQLINQVKARHILIQNSELVTPAQGMEFINEIYQRIQKGEDFTKLAEEKSDDVNSAALGGDLGWFVPSEFGQRFQNIVEKLDEQEVSSPFQTQAGWHIVQKLGNREADVSDKIKRMRAKQAIHTRKMNEQIESWLTKIRGEAFVDIRI